MAIVHHQLSTEAASRKRKPRSYPENMPVADEEAAAAGDRGRAAADQRQWPGAAAAPASIGGTSFSSGNVSTEPGQLQSLPKPTCRMLQSMPRTGRCSPSRRRMAGRPRLCQPLKSGHMVIRPEWKPRRQQLVNPAQSGARKGRRLCGPFSFSLQSFSSNSAPAHERSGVSFALKPSRYQLRGKINKGCCLSHSVVRAKSPSCARTETSDARLHDCCRNGARFGRCVGRPGAIRCLNWATRRWCACMWPRAMWRGQPKRQGIHSRTDGQTTAVRCHLRLPISAVRGGQPHQRRAESTHYLSRFCGSDVFACLLRRPGRARLIFASIPTFT